MVRVGVRVMVVVRVRAVAAPYEDSALTYLLTNLLTYLLTY